ncbi:hypothetical protein BGZ83_003121 [Gryganskiella cystojenkinii]|nr:hypothetical protein BGZ83_003121 [Gryganskiella cystojenkinii]
MLLLLGRKIRGPLTGQWNGFGGKVERGLDLSVAESAARELLEEAFLEAPLFPIGYVQWVVEPLEPATSTAHGIEAKRTGVEDIYRDIMVVYKAHSFARPSISALSSTETTASTVPCDHTTQLILEEEFLASDEMAPAWWPVSELPWDHMRINHKVWYPFLLADRIYRAVYWYKTHLSDYQEKDGQELEGSKKKSAANAQRETAKEIWVENLERRCIQFGPEVQMPGKEIRTAEEQQARLDDFAQQLGLLHAFSDGKEHPQHYCPGGSKRSNEREHKKPDPAPCESLDEKWMREAIIKAEVDWLVI